MMKKGIYKLLDTKKLKKKEKEKNQTLQFLQEIMNSIKKSPYSTYWAVFKDLKMRIDKVSLPRIINHEIKYTDLGNIRNDLTQINKIIRDEALSREQILELDKLIQYTLNYFDLKEFNIILLSSVSSSSLLEQANILKNWNKSPIIFFMTIEQGKSYKFGATISEFGMSGEITKSYKKLSFDKCKKCKGKNFSFVDEKKDTIYCNKCGQKYQVIEPISRKIWAFK